MLNRSRFAQLHFGRGSVAPAELRRCVMSAGMVVDYSLALLRLHNGVKIRQVKEHSSSPDGGQASRVKAEKIHTRFAAEGHIGADVQLRKAGQSWKWRESPAANPTHVKGCDCYPTLTVKRIESELRWHQRTHDRWGQRPMGKQQIVPSLLHHPPTRRQRPWLVRDGWQQRIHLCKCRLKNSQGGRASHSRPLTPTLAGTMSSSKTDCRLFLCQVTFEHFHAPNCDKRSGHHARSV
jgi:hypothetical protein